ncbi:TPA: hypothetical protein DCQ44_01170 [Candidatus Taylorbacteria bacterium]|nr:hypothetical protein [Candidatus Taylorbacteria bacterium]
MCEFCGKNVSDHASGCPLEKVDGQSAGEHAQRRAEYYRGKNEALLGRLAAPRSENSSYLLGWNCGQAEIANSTPDQLKAYRSRVVSPF